MTSVYAGHLTTGNAAPRDERGGPIPDATFQLYESGTTTPPTYYTNRVKGGTVGGSPTTDERGNIDAWVEPGTYDYYFDGVFIQTITIDEDNGEDDAALAAAVAAIDTNLSTNYYTKDEVDSAIEAGGGIVTGALLSSDLGVTVAQLTSGVVPDAELPASAKTAPRIPTAHASTHAAGGSDPVSIAGTYTFVEATGDYSANAGEFVYVTADGATITLPSPANGSAMIYVKAAATVFSISVAGTIDGDLATVPISTFAVPEIITTSPCLGFISGPDSWYKVSEYNALGEYGSNIYAMQNGAINMAGQTLQGYTDHWETVSTTTADIGTSYPSPANTGTRIRCTNGGATTLTLLNSAPEGYTATVLRRGGKITLVAEAGGALLEPDGLTHVSVVGGQVELSVDTNADGHSAQWIAAGRTGT